VRALESDDLSSAADRNADRKTCFLSWRFLFSLPLSLSLSLSLSPSLSLDMVFPSVLALAFARAPFAPANSCNRAKGLPSEI